MPGAVPQSRPVCAGAGLGFVTGAISVLASGVRSAHKAGENPWTGKAKAVKTQQEIRYDTKQIGKKYGEHMKDYPGETHYYNNGNLLRIAPDGTFRSLYPFKF